MSRAAYICLRIEMSRMQKIAALAKIFQAGARFHDIGCQKTEK